MLLPPILAFSFPLRLEYFSWWVALALLAALGLPIVWLGARSLTGMDRIRRFTAIGVRLLVLLLCILILGGIRYQRTNKDLEVMVLRDISQSTTLVREYPGENLNKSIDTFLTDVSSKNKPPADRIGVISFHTAALVDSLPEPTLLLDARASREAGNGTDVASAIQLALATLSKDAMHRLLLVWDGNQTLGDIDEAVASAASAHIPIDIMPLTYDVQNEVLVDRFVAPTWKRENEPFTVDIILKSNNPGSVTGKLTVLHQGEPMDLDAATDGVQATKIVTLAPGLNVEHVRVPALEGSNVIHQFRAIFEGQGVDASVAGGGATTQPSQGTTDTLAQNNAADAFTFVRGRGQILYVDNYAQDSGRFLLDAVRREGIEILDSNRITPDAFPNNLVQLQNYDAIILANVPRGSGGITEEQQKMLATYVHDMGGGLLMIGGEETFGAGGWQGSKLEEVLPVNMDIPAQRQIPKGALVLVMHSCEMPDGNYWGEQCALKAIETLSDQDEVGIVTYGSMTGGSKWEYVLAPKGDGTKIISAIKNWTVGDMPSFDDSMNVALNGLPGEPGLLASNAKQKHVIIISDGDPGSPNPGLVAAYTNAKVSASTITVYPHMGDPDGLPPTMKAIARLLKGRAYGPINNNPNQLPQIFIKEATVVRRSLIQEDAKGIAVSVTATASDIVKGVASFPPVTGLVLTSRKQNPQIEVPLVAGKNADPILAHWQTGLGRAAVFTSDARNKWGASWIAAGSFGKFWAQAIRSVARPPMSADFEVGTTITGEKGSVRVEAIGKDSAFLNFLSIRGTVVGPDMKASDVRLVQTGPGTYEAQFDTPLTGNYVVVLNYRGPDNTQGVLLSGAAMNQSPELRDLSSNPGAMQRVADQTGGKVLAAWNVAGADIFRREGLWETASPKPIWDWLVPFLIGLLILDVAVRRIAWDLASLNKVRLAVTHRIRAFTTTRKIETTSSVDALRKIRAETPDVKPTGPQEKSATVVSARPDPKAKFEATGRVEGDISKVVGGATDKPIPSAPKKIEPKGGKGEAGGMSSLMAAKKRAQDKIREREEE